MTVEWDKPEGIEEWLAVFSVILLVTAGVAIPLVGGVMHWALDSPLWTMVVAVMVILAAVTWLAFAPEIEDEPAEDQLRWVRVRPQGVIDWARFAGTILASWIGLSFLINFLILDLAFGVSESTRSIVAAALFPIAVLLALFDVVDVEPESASEPAPEHPDQNPSLVDA